MHSQVYQELEAAKRYQQQESYNTSIRETAGSEVMNQLTALVDRAQKLAFLVEDRLFPITSKVVENNKQSAVGLTPNPTLPPLFEDIKTRLLGIENSLKTIEETMNRVEL